ncbi:LacI family DNA-binding transcriptional regulator [Tessaracoccus sp. G1721]
MGTVSGRGRRKTGPSIEDVARLAGVSAQTVSRVSTGADPVRPETKAKVMAAIAQLGYSPNRAARALRNGSFGTLGLLAHRYERTGEVLTTGAVVKAADEEGYTVTLLSIDDETALAKDWESAAHRISNQAIDGLVIIRAEEATPETLTLPAGMPVAVSDSRLVGHYPAVMADQVPGARDATRHLLGLGHRRVDHLAGPADSEPALMRRGAWERTLEAAGISAPPAWQGDWTPASGYAMGRRIAEDPGITAVFCANDEMAFGLIRALNEAGRRVPEDVSVVGFDAIALSEYIYPPLTTVRQNFDRIGHELVKLVLAQIRSQGVTLARHDRVVVPTELIVRATTAPPPA